jgi:hypothetical protein
MLFDRDTIQEEGILLDLEKVLGLEQEVHLELEPVPERGLHLESYHYFHFQWGLWKPLWRSLLNLGSLLSWWYLGWCRSCQIHWYWYYQWEGYLDLQSVASHWYWYYQWVDCLHLLCFHLGLEQHLPLFRRLDLHSCLSLTFLNLPNL